MSTLWFFFFPHSTTVEGGRRGASQRPSCCRRKCGRLQWSGPALQPFSVGSPCMQLLLWKQLVRDEEPTVMFYHPRQEHHLLQEF